MKKNIFNAFLAILLLTVSAQFSFGQKAAPNTKKQLIANLVEATVSAFPKGFFEKSLEDVKNKSIDGFKNEMTDMLNSKIEENADFSAEKKAEVKQKVPAVAEKLGERVAFLVTQDLSLTKWIKEGLAENYGKKLTLAEMRQVNTFLKSAAGKSFLAVMNEIASAEVEKREPAADSLLTRQNGAQIEKFLKTPAAKKFMAVFTEDMEQNINRKVDAWGEQIMKSIQEDVLNGEINKILLGFYTENFSGN